MVRSEGGTSERELKSMELDGVGFGDDLFGGGGGGGGGGGDGGGGGELST